jgi:hypothetical protein
LVASCACPGTPVDEVGAAVAEGSDDDAVLETVVVAADLDVVVVARAPAVVDGAVPRAFALDVGDTPLAEMVTRTSGSTTKLGFTAHPPGLLRCRRNVRAGSLVE